MSSLDVGVVGGGIAGLSAAFHLARAGVQVRLFEQEPLLATHSSGRNAAIFRELEERATETSLAGRTRAILDEHAPGWLERQGLIFVGAEPAPLEALDRRARAEGVRATLLSTEELLRLAPAIRGGLARAGLHCPDDGIIDVDRVCTSLARAAAAAGAQLERNRRVARIEADRGAVSALRLEDGARLPCGAAIIGGGAWASALGESAGAPLRLLPYRRHLAVLETPLPASHPIVMNPFDGVYFRPESGGALASPCDETPWRPELPPTDDAALAELGRKLEALAPALATAGVRRAWAGLRTFADDRGSVVGADPRVRGLYWLAGLGGHGMTCGPAAGEVLSRVFAGDAHPLAGLLSPARLLK